MTLAIGLLGGSFDPLHAGHLQLARDALAQLALAEVRFIPAGQPWQKGELTDATHRARMVLAAIAGEPRFLLDVREIERPGPTYTIDTLRGLRTALGEQVPLVLIMGSDQFERLDTWREWEAIAELAHLAVARRAGVAAARLGPALAAFSVPRHCGPAELAHRPAGGIVDFRMTPVDASATEVRQLLASGAPDAGRRLAELVPAAVLDYIRTHRLYT